MFVMFVIQLRQNIGKGMQNLLNIYIKFPFHQLLLHDSISFLQVNPEPLQVGKYHFWEIEIQLSIIITKFI